MLKKISNEKKKERKKERKKGGVSDWIWMLRVGTQENQQDKSVH